MRSPLAAERWSRENPHRTWDSISALAGRCCQRINHAAARDPGSSRQPITTHPSLMRQHRPSKRQRRGCLRVPDHASDAWNRCLTNTGVGPTSTATSLLSSSLLLRIAGRTTTSRFTSGQQEANRGPPKGSWSCLPSGRSQQDWGCYAGVTAHHEGPTPRW